MDLIDYLRGLYEIINDIKETISRINKYTEKMQYDEFIKEIKTQDAVIRNFEIIGEAVKSLPKELLKNKK